MTKTSKELKNILDSLDVERNKLVGDGKLAFELGILYERIMGQYKRTFEWEKIN